MSRERMRGRSKVKSLHHGNRRPPTSFINRNKKGKK